MDSRQIKDYELCKRHIRIKYEKIQYETESILKHVFNNNHGDLSDSSNCMSLLLSWQLGHLCHWRMYNHSFGDGPLIYATVNIY